MAQTHVTSMWMLFMNMEQSTRHSSVQKGEVGMSTHTVHTTSLATQALGRRKSLHCALNLFSPQHSHGWCLKAVSNYSSREFKSSPGFCRKQAHIHTCIVCVIMDLKTNEAKYKDIGATNAD